MFERRVWLRSFVQVQDDCNKYHLDIEEQMFVPVSAVPTPVVDSGHSRPGAALATVNTEQWQPSWAQSGRGDLPGHPGDAGDPPPQPRGHHGQHAVRRGGEGECRRCVRRSSCRVTSVSRVTAAALSRAWGWGPARWAAVTRDTWHVTRGAVWECVQVLQCSVQLILRVLHLPPCDMLIWVWGVEQQVEPINRAPAPSSPATVKAGLIQGAQVFSI